MLSGADNVERWTTQEIWDAILSNIRIVVSTPQVLLDALSNGFLKLSRIALLVFDEGIYAKFIYYISTEKLVRLKSI